MNLMERIEGEVIQPFDYPALEPDVAREARAAANRVRERNKAAVLETGQDLLVIKEKLGHGHFGPWLAAEFGMDERSAQRFMNAAVHFGDKSDIVSVLPSTVIYKLSARSTPAAVREEVVQRTSAGERLTPRTIEDMLYEAKKAEKEAKITPEVRAAEKAKKERRDRRYERRQAKWREEQAREDGERKIAAAEMARLIAARMGDDTRQVAEYLKKHGGYSLAEALLWIAPQPRLNGVWLRAEQPFETPAAPEAEV